MISSLYILLWCLWLASLLDPAWATTGSSGEQSSLKRKFVFGDYSIMLGPSHDGNEETEPPLKVFNVKMNPNGREDGNCKLFEACNSLSLEELDNPPVQRTQATLLDGNNKFKVTETKENVKFSRARRLLSSLEILSGLYSSTGGGTWASSLYWLTGDPCEPTATWFGITCTSGEVVGISLGANSLEGTLPSQLGLLSLLSSDFDLNTNALLGSVPSELGAFSRLATSFQLFSNSLSRALPSELGQLSLIKNNFNLGQNSLTGALPSELGQLSVLSVAFSVEQNMFTGNIPSQLGQLTGMTRFLFLYACRFTGSIPSELGRLSIMTTGFYLNLNSLTSSIPSQLGKLTSVANSFYLYSNSLSGSIPSQLGGLNKLSAGFSLNNNQLTNSIPSELGELTLLTSTFTLSFNSLAGTIPSELGGLKLLSSNFILSSNRLTGVIPTQLGLFSQMKANFYLNSNTLSGSIPSELGMLTQMTASLYLDSNTLSGSIPSQLGMLTQMTASLYLNSNTLSGSIPSELGLLTQMKASVDLSSNILSKSVPSQLGMLTLMTANFYLNSNQFCGDVPLEVAALSSQITGFDVMSGNTMCTYDILSSLYVSTTGSGWTNNFKWIGGDPCTSSWYGLSCTSGKIVGIDLSVNNLEGSLPSQLGLLSRLSDGLQVHVNTILGLIPSELGLLSQLTTSFRLDSNGLTSFLPSELGQLSLMRTRFSIGNNFLSGTLPSELGRMSDLVSNFALNGNMFTGNIPSQLGQLTRMTNSFYLYTCSFSGNIPSQLGRLNALTSNFMLHVNMLSGVIPSQLGQLSNMKTNLFLSSNRLTGLIPTQLGQLTQMLSNFFLSTNTLSGFIPSQLGLLSQMTVGFYLSSNQLCGDVPPEVAALSLQVTGFDVMSGNAMCTYDILSSLYVSTGGTGWTTKPNWLSNYGVNPCTSGGWFGVTCVSGSVRQLSLGSNNLYGSIPSELGLLTALTSSLELSANKLFGDMPSQLGKMTLLIAGFDLYDNQFSGSIPSQLGSFTRLTSDFIVFSNSFSGSVPSELGRLTLLTSNFKLSSNSLCGDIPSQVSSLSLQVTSGFNLTTGNFIGTFCCVVMPTITCDPTLVPTPLPTRVPTLLPTLSLLPTPVPSSPTSTPTPLPTFFPTSLPTSRPTSQPFPLPTQIPTHLPSPRPSLKPTPIPTSLPTPISLPPTSLPTSDPTLLPSPLPSPDPLAIPSPLPTMLPTPAPSPLPTIQPSLSLLPTPNPTGHPTFPPSMLPTIVPSPEPSQSPSQLPTSVPTVSCSDGSYFSDSSCLSCPVGQYSYFNNTPPYPTTCTLCPVGQYSTQSSAVSCTTCAVGKLSSADRTYCEDCSAGEYNFNNTECVKCEHGKYAPQALTNECLTCGAGSNTNNATGATTCTACDSGKYSLASSVVCSDCSIGKYSLTGATQCTNCETGKYTDSEGSGTCSNCAVGASSSTGSSACLLADEGYFLAYPDSDTTTCPKNADCPGNTYAPLPNTGYWVDRSLYKYATDIYQCPRETCKGASSNSSCWKIVAYNHSDRFDCIAADLLCTEGALGPLCGSCDKGYVYRGETKSCSTCGSAKAFAYTIVGIVGGIVLISTCLTVAYRYGFISLSHLHLDSFDSGSLKVLWVTYQIIMSVTWNLDVKFPASFSRMLSLLSVLSLEILSLECFHTARSSERYFVTVYLWSILPILLAAVLVMVGVLRYVVAMSSRQKTAVLNQHAWLLLLLSYLVLPPVAMKQLQGLDCIPFPHDNSFYLRVDTGVNCQSKEYYVFKAIVILFFCCYQSIPIMWMTLLYRKREALHVPRGPNEKSALSLRDADPSLSYLKFLFKDYRGEKWWFEVAEMYRRIMYIGVLPLFTPDSSKRASLGCIFAIMSYVYFREEEPFRVSFTNNIACIAQFTILLTFYTALSIDSGVVIDFGLGDFGIGLFLIGINLLIFALVLVLAFDRYKKRKEEKQWRQPLSTQQLRIVERVMNSEISTSQSEPGFNDNDSFDSSSKEVCEELKGIELVSVGSGQNPKRKSVEERDKTSSEILKQFLLQPKVVVMTKRVGAGAFGEVFKGTCMGETVAIKTMIDVTEANVREFKAEIILTASLRHPNIVNFVGACWGRELMCLVLEWVAKGSLRDLLETPDLKWNDPLLRLACDMARGMNYLHNRKFYDEREEETVACILHRDLKPDNALISEYTAAKLADFGTSRSKAEEDVTMTAVGTPLYVAPEIARGEHYDESVDVYSFGLTLMEMCVEQPILDFIGTRWMVAFDKKKIPKQPMRLIRPMTEEGWRPVTEDNPIPFAPSTINNLIIKCCNHDASKRPKFESILDELNNDCKSQIDVGSYGRRQIVAEVQTSTEASSAIMTNNDKTTNKLKTAATDPLIGANDIEVVLEESAIAVPNGEWVENPFSRNSIELRKESIGQGNDAGSFL